MIELTSTGSVSRTERRLRRLGALRFEAILKNAGERGARALAEATPERTGETANSWDYEVRKTARGFEIVWKNTHSNDGVNIAVIIQHGHGTRQGGYVHGIDYINPAMRPIFEQIVRDVRKAVTQ